ncbi:protein cubitus interruptus-like [Culex pipiens pallens]|uniref:protein cubitus interruptus-like n=1 Tax=Culex pipiens pallens TaxID=42434 RepID=UPI0019546A6C|nr:protein cubitus interruptus-like [Culex pipiens pallens]
MLSRQVLRSLPSKSRTPRPTGQNTRPAPTAMRSTIKRYTDPTSLGKHVKAVHGPNFYANKKQKGYGYQHDEEGSNPMLDGSRRSEDMHGMANNGKTTSMSSPSIKAESDAHSTGAYC